MSKVLDVTCDVFFRNTETLFYMMQDVLGAAREDSPGATCRKILLRVTKARANLERARRARNASAVPRAHRRIQKCAAIISECRAANRGLLHECLAMHRDGRAPRSGALR